MSLIQLFRQRTRQILIFSGMVLLVHMLKFTNYLPNWDSMYGIVTPKTGMLHFGRWFSGYSAILLHTPFDLPWVEGIASALLIALSITVVLDLFKLDNRLYAGIAAFLFGAFPSMASTFAYGFWAPSYMLSILLTFSGVYLCVHEKSRWVVPVSAIFFALGLGIYQIYYPLGMLLFLYYIARLLMQPDAKEQRIKPLCARFLPSFFAGGLLYWILGKIMLVVSHTELSSYQGISSAGILPGVGMYLRAAKKILSHFLRFFFTGINFYSILNAAIVILLLALVIRLIFLNRQLSAGRKILVCLFFATVVPGTYCYYLVSTNVKYRTQMELGTYCYYSQPNEHKKRRLINHSDQTFFHSKRRRYYMPHKSSDKV